MIMRSGAAARCGGLGFQFGELVSQGLKFAWPFRVPGP